MLLKLLSSCSVDRHGLFCLVLVRSWHNFGVCNCLSPSSFSQPYEATQPVFFCAVWPLWKKNHRYIYNFVVNSIAVNSNLLCPLSGRFGWQNGETISFSTWTKIWWSSIKAIQKPVSTTFFLVRIQHSLCYMLVVVEWWDISSLTV